MLPYRLHYRANRTTSPVRTASSIASVTSRLLRASCGRVSAQGHPGYRSTPEMAVCVALGLADGTLGRTPHFGIVSPAAGLGIEAVPALAAAGLSFTPGP